jgi:hypothetical protein
MKNDDKLNDGRDCVGIERAIFVMKRERERDMKNGAVIWELR